MGNPKFYFYPQPSGNHLETIDLEEGLGELSSDWEIQARDGVGLDGGMFRSVGLHRQVITIQRDRMKGGEELAHKFAALQNHLDRGYSVSFAADSDKAWCAPVTNMITGGDTTVTVAGNPFRSFVGTNTPSNNDYFSIETGSPGVVYEVKKKSSGTISAYSGGTITFDSGICFSRAERTFVRHYRFWPILKRAEADIGQNIVTNEHGLLWSFAVRLVVDSRSLFYWWTSGQQEFNFPDPADTVPELLVENGYDRPDFPSRNDFNYSNDELIDRYPWNDPSWGQ